MKRLILAIAAATALTATNAFAIETYLDTPNTDGSQTHIRAWSAVDTDYVSAITIQADNLTPLVWIRSPDSFLIGGLYWSQWMDNKADANDLSTLETNTSASVTDLQSQITASEVNSDWNASSGLAQILHKPSLFDGAYASLTGKPTIPTTFDGLTDGTTNKAYTATEKTKLAGVATGATANSSDATLLARANHTGTQAASTITGLSTVATTGAYTDLTGKPTIPSNIPTVYDGTTLRTNPVFIYKSITVASGVGVMYLTADNTSTGTALCPNGVISASISPIVNDAAASYQMGWAVTNSNKTLTVTTNNFTTANILSGLLGQAQANGKVVNASVVCY